jgi:hypothetical protein
MIFLGKRQEQSLTVIRHPLAKPSKRYRFTPLYSFLCRLLTFEDVHLLKVIEVRFPQYGDFLTQFVDLMTHIMLSDLLTQKFVQKILVTDFG